MNKNKELKPCPFCGGIPDIGRYHTGFNKKSITYIYCHSCGVQMTARKNRDAVDAWNNQIETRKPCEWSAPDDDGIYKTDCGLSWICDNGTPEENKMKYCPQCGGLIIMEKETE